MKINFLILLFILFAFLGCQNSSERGNLKDPILKYIQEIIGSNSTDGNYILLADNSCQGCKKLIQKYAATRSAHEAASILIIRDIKNLTLLKEDFKGYPGLLYLDSLGVYEKSLLSLPPAISITIQGNTISYNQLELDGIMN